MQSSYHGVEKEVGAGDGSREKEKKGPKKIESFSSLQVVEFDIDAIKEIKRRKRRLCKRGSNRKI